MNKVFKRKIEDRLLAWKSSYNKKPLIIEGGRQIGKTFSIASFAKSEYKEFFYVNFVIEPDYKEIFSKNLDAENILSLLTLYAEGKEVIENDTIIFLDEVQECPEALVSLKSFAQQKKVDVICSGSLIGMTQSEYLSYPMGYAEIYQMHPMDFEEFLDAIGKKIIIKDILLKCFMKKENIPKAFSEKIEQLFRAYLLTGGLPSVVLTYIETKDFNKIDKAKMEVINGYIKDITSYGDLFEKSKASELLFSIPKQLLKDNKKFQFSKIKKHARLRDYENVLNWLTNSGVIYPLKKVESLNFDMIPCISDNNFKLFLCDTGLLLNLYQNRDIWKRIAEGDYFVSNGSIIENYILECLIKQDLMPYFYKRESGLEFEFVVHVNELLIPLSFKKNISFDQSVDIVLKEEYKSIKFGFRISKNSFSFHESIYTIPVYSVFLLNDYLKILDPNILYEKIKIDEKDEEIKDDKDLLC